MTDKLTQSLRRTPTRMAVFRALKLGDLLCAVPAFRALRRAFPQTHIALISLPWAAEFADRFSAYFDEFIPFPGWPGLPEQPLDPVRTVQFLADMQARQWDVVLQQQGNGTLVNAMLTLFGAGVVAGFHPLHHPERFAPNPDLFMPYPEEEHEVKRHVHLLNFLDIPTAGYELEFPTKEADSQLVNLLMEQHGLVAKRFVVLHAGGISGRRWPAASFAEVGNGLAGLGYTIVLTGTAAEAPVMADVQAQMRFRAVSLAGQTDLGTLAALLREAVVLVSNDTGVSHLAAACHVPSVVIFTSARPAEWAPLNQLRHRAIAEADATPSRVVAAALDVAALTANLIIL